MSPQKFHVAENMISCRPKNFMSREKVISCQENDFMSPKLISCRKKCFSCRRKVDFMSPKKFHAGKKVDFPDGHPSCKVGRAPQSQKCRCNEQSPAWRLVLLCSDARRTVLGTNRPRFRKPQISCLCVLDPKISGAHTTWSNFFGVDWHKN